MLGSIHSLPATNQTLTIPTMLSLLTLIRREADIDDVLADFSAIVGVAIDHLLDLQNLARLTMLEEDRAPLTDCDEPDGEHPAQSRSRRLC